MRLPGLKKISPRWFYLGLGVIALAGVFIRLGIWQLDRLSQRRAENARLASQISAPVVNLIGNNPLEDPSSLEYRTVTVAGQYDFAHQVALASRTYNGQLGIDLVTPLVIRGSGQTVLVDRGWIPVVDVQRDAWSKYDQPGQVTIQGMARLSQANGGLSIPVTGSQSVQKDFWSSVAVPAIQNQVPEKLLPFYIQELPGSGRTSLPYAQAPQIDLSDGPHLGYALEWFSFAAMVLIGYPFWVSRQLRQPGPRQAGDPAAEKPIESQKGREADFRPNRPGGG